MTVVAVLPVAWVVLLAGTAFAFRPRSRPRPLVDTPGPSRGGASAPRLPEVVVAVPTAVGTAVLTVLRRPTPSSAHARQVGVLALVASAGSILHPLAGVVLLLIGVCLPSLVERRADRARVARFEAELPDLVDLFLLAVDAGLTVPLAVAAVARRAPGALAAEFATVVAEVDRGRRLADALEQLPSRTADALRPLTSVLISSERYGTPVAVALERLAIEVRISAQRRAEEAARRVPVTLLFPLVLCILPAFALLTVAPLVANGLRSLRL